MSISRTSLHYKDLITSPECSKGRAERAAQAAECSESSTRAGNANGPDGQLHSESIRTSSYSKSYVHPA